jgi:hypothetical protein
MPEGHLQRGLIPAQRATDFTVITQAVSSESTALARHNLKRRVAVYQASLHHLEHLIYFGASPIRGTVMATTKPRLTITLNPHTYAVITELSRLQSKPKAHIITELLDTVVPVFERTAYLLQMADTASIGVNDDIRDSMERAEERLRKMMDSAFNQLDMLSESLPDGVDGGIGEKQSGHHDAAKPGSLPPHSNTGVTIGDNTKNLSKNNS